jgi:hypothetical protein
MPFARARGAWEGLLLLRGSGPGSLDETLGALATVLGEVNGRPAAILLDFRAQAYAPDGREARMVAELIVSLPPASTRIALLANAGAQFGCARMISGMAEVRGARVAAFLDEAEALRWLGVPSPASTSGPGAASAGGNA